ncbi:Rhamnogalacturonan acetylesterase RhgT [Mariniflexile rhizosphaerae]|uniref:GDSL-type esterase/lipase family protein n=1 Tax=unclassified Mariniflexile TaxID=2643887 RepID=UPI000E333974|nr:GDSL-type esterase/lipase family protein [Mariniflexile sp. TRM1-10]AXP81338.1 Rhamnogalacturonan acetylesterase RhgT [Mariniflexile sp. TRM1-10]
MKSLLKLFIGVFAFCNIISANAQITLHTIGDSTMADYDENTTDKRGWGMMFQQFFTSEVVVNNRAKGGASSKSFYLEAPYWTTVKQQIETGDYVIIQFAHNDEKNDGLDGGTDPNNPINGTDYRGTTADGTYKEYLRKYIDETRALGATPILATAMCRKYFSGGTITRKGRHDLGENFGVPESNHTYDYSYAMQDVATEKSVQLIDLTTLTKGLLESYGDAESTAQLFVSSDSTHPNALGATLVARLCAQEMTNQNILASYINTSTDVLINPSNCDFGEAYAGQTLAKELTITGFDLEPASGTFTLSVSDGFLIAANKADTFASSITMDYVNSSLEFSKFYISVSQSVGGNKAGTLTVTNGTVTKEIPLTANYIELTGGTEVNLLWELSADDSYVLEGPAIPLDESHSNMYVNRYAQPSSTTTWPAESGYVDRKTQRNLIDGDTWPAGEIDEVSTRYIQFGISASEGTELNIDDISLYVGGSGGSGMRCRISYSKDDFATTSVVEEFSSMVSNTMYAVSKQPVIKLAYGETLKLRVYPWYNGEASGKTICLADVKIHGVATPTLSTEKPLENRLKWIVQNDIIKIKNAPVNSIVAIYDLTGRLIYKSSNNRDEELLIIKSPTTKGIYIGKVESQEGVQTTKFFVP